MGTYFNPGNSSFLKDSRSRIYKDKTGLLDELNQVIGTGDCLISLSHARRFGKSQAAGMIDAYYCVECDSRELFADFDIAKTFDFEKHLNKYNVIHIDMATVSEHFKGDLVQQLTQDLKEDLRERFKDIDYSKMISVVLDRVCKLSGKQLVIIIDEWDCVIRNYSDQPDLVHEYLQFLHALFKSEDSKRYLALGYITGILPIKKVKDESALNNFREYSMISSKRFTKYFGFTEDEVKDLCEQYGMEFESVKKWYNGYLIDGMHMYNPNSVSQALIDHSLESYWKNTSSFETINDLITLNVEHLKDDVLKMLEGKQVSVNTGTFKNDLSEIRTKDEALTALIHLGYLGYDARRKKAFIPNYEVATAYEAALTRSNWTEIANTISRCDELLNATLDMDAERVAELVELAHDAYTSVLEYNDENALSCVVTMAYFTAPAQYNVIREFPAGKGFADIVMIPRADACVAVPIVIELKWSQSADTAIQQIKDRRYAGSLAGYSGEILLVGISYDKNDRNKKHQCIIERIKI